MASQQQQPPGRNYTLDAAADEAVAAERGTAENGTTEVRNPLAPPTSEPPTTPTGAAEPLQPPEDEEPGMCGHLVKAMYGTRDAPQNWEYEYGDFMTGCGFAKGRSTPCLFYHAQKNDRRSSIHSR